MNFKFLAKQTAEKLGLVKAYSYDFFLREFDGMVELIGLVDDPTLDLKDFQGREMLFPKKWVTLDVLDSNYEVKV
jgi:hypothetical protein